MKPNSQIAMAPPKRRRGVAGRAIAAFVTACGMVVSVAAAVHAAPGDIDLRCPEQPILAGSSFEAEILVDLGTRVLASYQISMLFDPQQSILIGVQGGASVEFSTPPEADPQSFTSGLTVLRASNVASTTSPSGWVSVARVQLESRGRPGEPFAVWAQPDTILDIDGIRLPSVARACFVFVEEGDLPTATPTPTGTPTPPPTPTEVSTAPCVGDCNGDREVTVDELLLGISIALGIRPVGDCPAFDPDGDGEVVVTDIVAAVNASLTGCPLLPPTSTPVPGTPTATATASATVPPNLPPVLGAPRLYRAFPDAEIRLAIEAIDPEGRALHYAASNLPQGAVFDEQSGLLVWTPAAEQIGPHYIPFVVTDAGAPPAAAAGMHYIQVEPRSPCLDIQCNPANGCVATPLPLGVSCCDQAPPPRVAWADAPCPAATAVFAGRNVDSGIGRLQHCDWLRVINFAQTGAAVRLNFEARCLSRQAGVRLRVRLDAPSRVVLDDDIDLTFFEGDNGFIERVTVPFTVRGGGPFFDLEDAEAILTVIATDGFGRSVRSDRRVRLNFDIHPDLADPFVPAPTVDEW